ncbi:MAG: adenylyl-sulfate kinase [Candidatus Cyclobacteriaceae bacterium M3_2C_046]
MLNIHPIFDRQLKQEDKEKLLQQKGLVIWFIGLSGSGKSTLANALENHLHQLGYLTKLLDGDNLRTGVNKNLGFSKEDRIENIRRAAETSKLFLHCGIITMCSLISPTSQVREMSRKIIGPENYVDVYVNCSLEVCEQRDVKGLYAKARKGEIPDFTGISSPFEPPQNPAVEVKTDQDSLEVCLEQIVNYIEPKIKWI